MPSPEAIERNRQRAKERYWKVKAMREADPELDREYHRVRLENERRRRRKNWQSESEKARAYYLANRERILEYGRKYYHEHKEQFAEYRRKYRSN